MTSQYFKRHWKCPLSKKLTISVQNSIPKIMCEDKDKSLLFSLMMETGLDIWDLSVHIPRLMNEVMNKETLHTFCNVLGMVYRRKTYFPSTFHFFGVRPPPPRNKRQINRNRNLIACIPPVYYRSTQVRLLTPQTAWVTTLNTISSWRQ